LLETLRSIESTAASGTAAGPPPGRIDEIVVVDNDAEPTAQATVSELISGGFPHRIRYAHEHRPGLAAARNRALDEAGGDVLVFIDDDERAEPGWPGGLVETMHATGAALVGGPVRTSFDGEPPGWIVEGGFFDRAEPPDRSSQAWLRSGNLAIDLAAVRARSLRFDQRFGRTGGEDVAFSTSARRLGLGLSWSSSAVVVEHVGLDRARLSWIMARERSSTSNWVRAELLAHPSPSRRALVAGRGATRLAQGALLVLAGLLTLRLSRIGRGLVRTSRGIGSFQGLVGHRSHTYGNGAAAS
jgi:GT2 family glycosyltransferase